jgi:hypothetical protein
MQTPMPVNKGDEWEVRRGGHEKDVNLPANGQKMKAVCQPEGN